MPTKLSPEPRYCCKEHFEKIGVVPEHLSVDRFYELLDTGQFEGTAFEDRTGWMGDDVDPYYPRQAYGMLKDGRGVFTEVDAFTSRLYP